MPRLTFLLAPLLIISSMLSAASAAPSGTPAPLARFEAEAGGFSSYRLANGFRIILLPFPNASEARVELLIRTGSKQEGYGETGSAHLLEHLLFHGAGRRKSIQDDLSKLALSSNASTSFDQTSFHETVPADPARVDEAIRLEADRFLRARITPADVAREIRIVLDEFEGRDQKPAQRLQSALRRSAFVWHGYGRDVIGARSDLESMSVDTLRRFYRTHYRPDNAALIVSGKFEPRRVLALASRLFSVAQNPAGQAAPKATQDPPVVATRRTELALPSGFTLVSSSWTLPGYAQRDVHGYDLAVTAICDPDWGSLRQDLVVERKLAVTASCNVDVEADYSRLIATARAPADADAEVLSKALVEHLEKAAAQGASPESFARARQTERYAFERIFDSHIDSAQSVSGAEAAGDWRLMFVTHDFTQDMSLEEANGFLRKWTVAGNRSDALLRHVDTVEPLAISRPPALEPLLRGKRWDNRIEATDPPPTSWGELARATRRFELEGTRVRAALITRRSVGGRVSLVLRNDSGNAGTLLGRNLACSFAGDLMAYGGAGLDREQIEARMTELQASWSIDLYGIRLTASPATLPEAFRVLMSVWRSPTLPVDMFEQLRASSLTRVASDRKLPEVVVSDLLARRYDNYPGGHPRKPRGFDEQAQDLRALQYEDVVRCARDFAVLNRVRLGVVGKVTEAEVRALWSSLGPLPTPESPYEPVVVPDAPEAVDIDPIVVTLPGKYQATVSGTTVLALNDHSPEHPALQLAVQILGDGDSSLLWKELRERLGLSYAVRAHLSISLREKRLTLSLQATTASDQAQRALEVMKSTVARAVKDGVSRTAVKEAKAQWAAARKSWMADDEGQADLIVWSLLDGPDHGWLERYDEAIRRVRAEEVTGALRRYLGKMVWGVGRGE